MCNDKVQFIDLISSLQLRQTLLVYGGELSLLTLSYCAIHCCLIGSSIYLFTVYLFGTY